MPSLLARSDTPGVAFAHRLNYAVRDQADTVHTEHPPLPPALAPRTHGVKTKATPPRIAADLTTKVMEYRIWHTREAGSAFLSQLEWQAMLERALRRANIPLAFSQGFHPLPLLSFGRALPVGVESTAEWFAMTLRRPVGADTLLQRLSPHLPCVLRADLVTKALRNTQAVRERFTCVHTGASVAQAAFTRAWEDFAACETFEHTRETKKGPRTQDIRALVAKIDIRGHTVDFTADWELGYISPLTLVLAVCGADSLAVVRVRKTAQLFDDGTCFPPE